MVLLVALIVLAVLAVWTVCAVGIALLTGGIIRERDERDRPLDSARSTERAPRHHVFS